MGIPSLQELMAMLDNCGAQSGQIPRSKPSRTGKLDWIEPVLRGRVAALNMDVRGLAVLQAVEEKSESLQSQNCRHVWARGSTLIGV